MVPSHILSLIHMLTKSLTHYSGNSSLWTKINRLTQLPFQSCTLAVMRKQPKAMACARVRARLNKPGGMIPCISEALGEPRDESSANILL